MKEDTGQARVEDRLLIVLRLLFAVSIVVQVEAFVEDIVSTTRLGSSLETAFFFFVFVFSHLILR